VAGLNQIKFKTMATKMVEYNGQMVEAEDITPTWAAMLPYYTTVLQDGNAEGKKIATKELQNMAKGADLYNELRKEFKKVLDEVDAAFATLFIGSDHGITPQAESACKQAAINVQIALGYRNEDGTMIEEEEEAKVN
jgi:TorA maturation chaperone TorD